jgi:formamidopyrimidine-DNA glycosylase
MPELPDVELARRLIEERALGRRIAAVDDTDTWVCRPHAPGEIAGALIGTSLTSAHRHGKTMWIETDRGPMLGLHLGMTGGIRVDAEPDTRGWDRFALEFEDGGRMALHDMRRLGRAVLDPDLSRLGPDAGEVGREEFRERVGRGTSPIKARLMDQGVIAGVGNLMADEILWQARIHPLTPGGELTEGQLDELRRAMRAVVRHSIERGHAGAGDLNPHRVAGGICPRCGATLERGRVGGRTTYWCPRDQLGP